MSDAPDERPRIDLRDDSDVPVDALLAGEPAEDEPSPQEPSAGEPPAGRPTGT